MSELHIPQINQVAFSGRVVADPEARMTDSGKFRVTFTLAVNRSYKDRSGDWQQETAFIPVVAWDKLAEAVARRLQKGSGVFLTGRMKSSAVETNEGTRTMLEVVARNVQFLSRKEEAEGSGAEEAMSA
jgi:single-strand DNA-binding protein